MNRQEYIHIKQTNPTELIYRYYKDNSNGKLNRNEVLMYIQMYANINSILNYVIGEYDRKFDVILILDAKGQYIKSI